MSIPAQGRVTLKDNQALVVLNVATNNNQAEERPRSDLEALVNRALRQEVPVYTQPGSHSSANTWRRWSATSRRGFHLDPVGLHGAWNAAAEQRLLECLTKPKRVVTPKPVVPAIAAPAPVLALIFISRAECVLLKLPVPHPQHTCMLLLRSFNLKMARCPIPRLLRIPPIRIPPLLRPRRKRRCRSMFPTHPCRRLQSILLTMSTVCQTLPWAHSLKSSRWRVPGTPSSSRPLRREPWTSSQVPAVPGTGRRVLVFGWIPPAHCGIVRGSWTGECSVAGPEVSLSEET